MSARATLVFLLAVLLLGCTELIQHGVAVPLTVRPAACDDAARVDAHSLHFTVTSRSGTVESDHPFAEPPAQLSVAPGDVSVFVEARAQGGDAVARGAALHLALPDAGTADELIIELYPVGRFTRECPTLGTARSAHTVTVLANGDVAIVGGANSGGTALASLELLQFPARLTMFPEALSIVSNGTRFALPRAHHAAVLTPVGQLLVSSGELRTSATTRAFPGSSLFLEPQMAFESGALASPTQPLLLIRSRHEALLIDGGVLLVGGEDHSGPVSAVVRIDLQTLQLAKVGALADPRVGAAIALVGQDVFVAGGAEDAGAPAGFVDVLPGGDAVHVVRSALQVPRQGARVVAVGGRALLVGGEGAQGAPALVTEWLGADARPGPALSPHVEPCAVSLGDRALVLGGRTPLGLTASAEVISADGSVEVVDFPGEARVGHRCVRLDDGSALVVGGEGVVGALNDLWRYVPR